MSELAVALTEPTRPVRSRAATRTAWEQRLARFAHSGLSPAPFCANEGVSLPSFYSWKRRLAAEGGGATEPAPGEDRSPRLLPVRGAGRGEAAGRDAWPSVLVRGQERLGAGGRVAHGRALLALNGSTPVVESLTLQERAQPVYNIEVEGHHCYRVGHQGLLVHNASVGEMPCPPTGSVNCDAEVTVANATNYELRNKAKAGNFIEGNLLKGGGLLYFLIANQPKDNTGCPGYWMFQQMVDHFGTSVLGIESAPVGSKPGDSDNLDEANKRTTNGAMTLLEAVWFTKTGIYAKTWGATKVRELAKPMGTPGNYTSYDVVFEK